MTHSVNRGAAATRPLFAAPGVTPALEPTPPLTSGIGDAAVTS